MRFEHTCQGADLRFLVQLRSLSLNLLLVITVQTLDIVYGGFQVLHWRSPQCRSLLELQLMTWKSLSRQIKHNKLFQAETQLDVWAADSVSRVEEEQCRLGNPRLTPM